jgi:sugar lactone lactonase YvrE
MRIRLPVSQVTSCTFGDQDLQTLYITSARVGLDAAQLQRQPLAGSLFAVRVNVSGQPAHRFAG